MEHQPLCRFVVWRRNNELPIWRMVQYTPGVAIQLRDLPWIAATCGDPLGLTVFEQFHYELGEWTIERMHDGEATIIPGSPIVLLRMLGVGLCPLFGHELAGFDRNLGHYYDPALLKEVDNRIDDDNAIRHMRVVAWTEIGEPPKIHHISFDNDNTIKIVRNYNLHKDLGRRETVNLWIPGGEWEGGVSVHNGFWVEERFNTILVKLTEVGAAIGLGKELIALEHVGKLRRLQRRVHVCLESYMHLARAVDPLYDIAIPERTRILYEHRRLGEGQNRDEYLADEVLTVDTVEEGSTMSTIPCKRCADDEDPRPLCRLKMSS